MRVCHKTSADFDDPNLISCAGLAPTLALAQRAGLEDLITDHVSVEGPGGANADLKVTSVVAGVVAGADNIDKMDLLRHGGMGRLFTGVRAPSTLGTFLRALTFGHVRQLDAVASRLLANLPGQAPVLGGADQIAYLDIDDTVAPTYGYTKQGAGHGYSGTKGLNVLVAAVCTPVAAPMIAATRLRRCATNSTRGAAKLAADALATIGRAGASGTVIMRADSAYYNHAMVAAAGRGGAHFSITARIDRTVTAAISTISKDAWTPIRYPNAIWEEAEGRWVSDAEVAEIPFHRVHLPHPGRTHQRPADRAPGQTAEPHYRTGRSGRTVRHLPPPRPLHPLTPGHASRRSRPPGPRDHRLSGCWSYADAVLECLVRGMIGAG